MVCVEDACSGEIDTGIRFDLIAEEGVKYKASPCRLCGRMHWMAGGGVFLRGEKIYYKKEQLAIRFRDGVYASLVFG